MDEISEGQDGTLHDIYVTLDRTSLEFREKYAGLELAVYSLLAFAIPFLFSQPQLLTGTIVNAFLVLSALHFKGWKALPLVFIPSIAAVLNGAVFGPFTLFLLYMLPFIWIGNFLLVYLMKRLHLAGGMNYGLSLGISVIAKSVLLFAVAHALVSLNVLPSSFLFAMGALQLVTGLAGGIAAFGIRGFYSYLLK